MRGFSTQFCIGVDYWLSVHINKDFYYTTLSCFSEDTSKNSLLFYFVFPSYRVAVPMRSGDVVCLNPLMYHCCTGPIKHGVNFFSCYFSAKICNIQIAFAHGNEVTTKEKN
jgi:hypothetical protein